MGQDNKKRWPFARGAHKRILWVQPQKLWQMKWGYIEIGFT